MEGYFEGQEQSTSGADGIDRQAMHISSAQDSWTKIAAWT